MTEASIDDRKGSLFGWSGFFLGAIALLAAVILFWAGPFAPQSSASVSLGELAAETARSALRSAVGAEQPAPAPIERTVDDYLEIAVGALGALAVVLGLAGYTRHESGRVSSSAIALGASAIIFQFFIWVIGVLAAVLIINAIFANFGEVVGSLFGGIGG